MHEGHRKRMIDKLLFNKEALTDHELLEILLYYCIPRKNVNETAHRLLESFGSLKNVLQADQAALCAVDGIGEHSAAFFITLNEIQSRIHDDANRIPELISYESCKSYLINSFRGLKEEKFIALFLSKTGEVLYRKIFCSHSEYMVNIDVSALFTGLPLRKPASVIISHNHLSGKAVPSASDDDATEKIYLSLKLNKISLNDHIIVADENTYSYRASGRLDEIKRRMSLVL